MRGRKPRPTDEKVARGETRPSRVNYQEPEVPAPTSAQLTAPKGLKGAGRAFWDEHLQRLVDSGKLRADCVPLFVRRCRTEMDLEHLRQQKARRGLDLSQRLSIERVLNQVSNRALREDAELGITPVSSARVKTVTKPPVEKPKHERFFGGLRGISGGRS